METLRRLGVDVVPVRLELAEPKPAVRGAARPPLDAPAAGGPVADGGAEAAPADESPAYTPVERPDRDLTSDEASALLEIVRTRYLELVPHRRFNSTHDNLVFGEGDPCAPLMFVGEAPGEQEDKTGRPFVGRAGQLLERMIVAMGLSRESVYICNVLKVRPPNNATPTPQEAAASAPFLLDQIRIVRPRVIVTLGLPATRLLLDTDQPMRALRGQFASFPPATFGGPTSVFSGTWDAGAIPVMPTYHPAYLLRSYTDENRRKVWSDLKQVVERLGSSA